MILSEDLCDDVLCIQRGNESSGSMKTKFLYKTRTNNFTEGQCARELLTANAKLPFHSARALSCTDVDSNVLRTILSE
jgi:hypothetical protein